LPEGPFGTRVVNPPIKGWLLGQPPERHPLTPERLAEDLLMTGLRTRRGVDLADLEARTGLELSERYRQLLGHLRREGLLEHSGGTLRATPAGLLVLNAVLREFFAVTSEGERRP
jgi:coproporphyrinogen III oxidase-like Fe-S oxidoreductase